MWDAVPCVMVTAKGMPDLATRAFCAALQARFPTLTPVGLVDYNPSGAVGRETLLVFHGQGVTFLASCTIKHAHTTYDTHCSKIGLPGQGGTSWQTISCTEWLIDHCPLTTAHLVRGLCAKLISLVCIRLVLLCNICKHGVPHLVWNVLHAPLQASSSCAPTVVEATAWVWRAPNMPCPA